MYSVIIPSIESCLDCRLWQTPKFEQVPK